MRAINRLRVLELLMDLEYQTQSIRLRVLELLMDLEYQSY